MYCSSSGVFMMNNTPSGMKKHRESTEPEICQMFFFPSSSSSSDGLVQNYTTHSRWFSYQTAAFYTEQCTSPLLSHNFEFSWGGSNRSLLNYCFICNTIFLTFTHAHKSLSNKTIIIIIQDWWIKKYGCVHGDRESLCHPLLTRCLNRA